VLWPQGAPIVDVRYTASALADPASAIVSAAAAIPVVIRFNRPSLFTTSSPVRASDRIRLGHCLQSRNVTSRVIVWMIAMPESPLYRDRAVPAQSKTEMPIDGGETTMQMMDELNSPLRIRFDRTAGPSR
jgi:hypothetical protein